MVRDELFRQPIFDRDFVWEALEPMVEYVIEFVYERYRVNPAQHRRKMFRYKSVQGEWVFCGKDCFPGDDCRRFYAGSGAYALRLEEATPVIMAQHTIPIVESKRKTTYARLQVLSDISPFLGGDYAGPVDRGFSIHLTHYSDDPRFSQEPRSLSSVSVYTDDDGYDWTPVVAYHHNGFHFKRSVPDFTRRDYRELNTGLKQSGLNTWRLRQGWVGLDARTLAKTNEDTALKLLDAIALGHMDGVHLSVASVSRVIELEMRHSAL